MGRKSMLRAVSLLSLTGAVISGGCIGEEVSVTTTLDEIEHGPIGEIGLELSLPDGSEVVQVSFSITRAGMTLREGMIPVTEGGQGRMQIGNLPIGTDYTISLSSRRGTLPPCQGSATFAISESETTDARVFMQCGTLGRGGNLALGGSFNYCPSAPTIVAAPTTVAVGQQITLSAEALDEDPVTFAWSAPSGTFSAPSQAKTKFKCLAAGTVTLTASASDSQGCTGITSTLDVSCTDAGAPPSATFSSQPAYLVAVAAGVQVRPILTAGDSPNNKPDGATPYRMVGLPDGLGAFDNRDGTFTLLSNHELGNTSGVARAHGSSGAFVSRWTVRKSDLGVLHGEDLIQTVRLWSSATSAYVVTPNVSFGRFCSADLPAISALYNAANATGFNGRLFLGGEEAGAEGRAFAHGMDGMTHELPGLGKANWENIVPSPFAQPKTIVVGLDDAIPGQVYVYVGNKTNAGSPIERAGLTNGALFGVVATGFPTEPQEGGIPSAPFTMFSLGVVKSTSGAEVEARSTEADVTRFNRPKDGAWDPTSPRDFYFVTSNSGTGPSRLWRLRFNDIARPELGGQLEMVLDGTEGQVALASLAIDAWGRILLQEDPGDSPRLARIYRYTTASDSLVVVAQHNPARFTTGAANFITQNEESSGVIDASGVLGEGWWLLSHQVHVSTGVASEIAEGGQYSAIYDPGTP